MAEIIKEIRLTRKDIIEMAERKHNVKINRDSCKISSGGLRAELIEK